MIKGSLSKLKAVVQDNYHIFICSSSFEDRCLSLPKRINKYCFEKVVVIENKNGSDRIKKKTEELKSMFHDADIWSIDFGNPIVLLDRITNEIAIGLGRKRLRVLVDVSTFSHEILIMVLDSLYKKKNIEKIDCIYLNAEDYCPNVNVKQKWLSKGSQEIHTVFGFPGNLSPSKKDRIIMIVGYEYERAIEIIRSYEPNYITLVYGEPSDSTTIKNKEANQFYTELIREMMFDFPETSIETKSISCNDPDTASVQLGEIISTHPDDNCIIVPMNNKLSTIGVLKAAMNNENIQICYAPALIYNEANYSIPGKNCYLYSFKEN